MPYVASLRYGQAKSGAKVLQERSVTAISVRSPPKPAIFLLSRLVEIIGKSCHQAFRLKSGHPLYSMHAGGARWPIPVQPISHELCPSSDHRTDGTGRGFCPRGQRRHEARQAGSSVHCFDSTRSCRRAAVAADGSLPTLAPVCLAVVQGQPDRGRQIDDGEMLAMSLPKSDATMLPKSRASTP